MATVTGYVQWITVYPSSTFAKIVGPTPTDTQLLLVLMESSNTEPGGQHKGSVG